MTKQYEEFEVGEALDAYFKDEKKSECRKPSSNENTAPPVKKSDVPDPDDDLIELTQVEEGRLILEKDAPPDIPELQPLELEPESSPVAPHSDASYSNLSCKPEKAPGIGIRADVPEELAREAFVDDSEFPKNDLDMLSEDLGNDAVIESASGEGGLADIREELQRLNQAFESKIKYDTHKETIIDRLHTELQSYRNGVLDQYLESLIMDFVKVIDDIRKMTKYYRDKELVPEDGNKLIDYLEGVPADLEDVFAWRGIRSFTYEDDLFDPSRQRIVKKISTDDPEKDRRVAETVRPGYERDGRILRPEMVTVYTTQYRVTPLRGDAKENG